ncbi:MAG: hypothetical protein K2J88_00055 [Oscillospiraceae bacterium]|nr:hypothetical protein [Oscillospiraceae bacterium]
MKKRILLFMLTALLVSTSSALRADALTLGDANGDSDINASDASDVLIHSASIGAGNGGTLFDEALTSADVNGDGFVDSADASEILVYAAETGAGNSYTFPAENQVTDDEWKQAYKIQLANLPTNKEYYYDLADINYDSIPELFITLWEDTPTTTIYSYQNGICQPIIFQTKSGAVATSLNTISINYSADTNSLLAWISQNDLLVGEEYQLNGTNASLKHEFIEEWTDNGTCYYYDDVSVTEEQYLALFENEESYFYYWLSYCSITDTDLFDAYNRTGELQVSFINDSVTFDLNTSLIHYDINCQNITENSHATINLVPHGTAHTLENVENTEISYTEYLYAIIHNSDKIINARKLMAGEYDLFLLADDGVTELDSVTFTVVEKDTNYKDIYKNKLASLSSSDYMYSLYDLDSNGIPELFISTGDYHAAGVELYTCAEEGILEQLNAEYGLGSYGTINVSDDILLSWHYGMDYESAFFYRMIDNTTLELQDYFSIDHNTTPATYCYYESNITEAEYQKLHAPYENLNYIALGRDYDITYTSPIDNY